MGIVKIGQATEHALNPGEDAAFDEIIITGAYYEESVADGLTIMHSKTAAALQALTPSTGLALGVVQDAQTANAALYLYLRGSWVLLNAVKS